MAHLLEFVKFLRERRVSFFMDSVRDAVMVIVPSPAAYFEVEFFLDNHIEIQEFGPAADVRDIMYGDLVQLVENEVVG